ncbi:MAG: hypothetical protein JXB23_17035 [Candidatus Aminicenantes bacterium]|nr:hypothetical protein [Candidatus Aminicenantes bacterium]
MLRNVKYGRILFLLIGALFISGIGISQGSDDSQKTLFKNIPWREIGPACFGGRIDDIEAVIDNPKVIFVATASGGIFKTENNGITWKPVFDDEGISLSIGDVAIAPSDPDIVWAGTGEPNGRQSSSWGDGVYKSLDGGESWTYMGLKGTQRVGRIVIHPQNPDIVFVAALGHLWGPNPERGLYRTKDGGKTWENVLEINSDTGVVDVAMEGNGRILYAAAYQSRRRAWGFVGGGPHGGLYRSLDGGDSWEKLTEGLPNGDIGRIGISISPSHPHIVYAIIENKNGGVFRSENRGETWTKMSGFNHRPMYYSQIRVDPKHPNKIWALGSPFFVSIDGGKTFSSEGTGEKIHVDHHALWINPKDPDHMILGNDGGLYMTYDGCKNWHFLDNLPIGQYYAIGIDTRTPYWIYGGTQDNGSWGIPSRTYSRLGIMNCDVVNISYGDGFYAAVDPTDHTTIYNESQSGRLYLVDLTTREEKGIRPVPEDPGEEYRWNWSCPLVISPHDPKTVYYGGNRLFKTTDRAHSWEVISPDLTKNQDWKKIPVMGLVRNEDTLSRDDGVSDYGTLTTISESPVQSGLIYVGTDDGNVQMTQDGGKNWANLTQKFRLPGDRWVTRVLASHHGAGIAYVAFSGHQDDDFTPYIFKTTDFGATWKMISKGIPDGMVVNAVAEHPRDPNLLFAGTEFGLFATLDGGTSWILADGGLPRVPVDDIIVNARENDLILGTHGRSIIILDDIGFLEETEKSVLESEAYLFPPREAVQFYEMRELPTPGASEFSGPNPDYGALITYYLKNDPPERQAKSEEKAEEEDSSDPKPQQCEKPKVKIVILDGDGSVVRELEGPDRKGMNRINWDLRYPLSFEAKKEDEGWFGPHKGPFALPGEYTVKLIARDLELAQKFNVKVDPQANTGTEALKARFEASMEASELQRAFKDAQKEGEKLVKEMDRLKKMLKDKEDVPEEISAKMKDVEKKFKELIKDFKGGWGGPEFEIMDLAGQLQASTSAPTQAQLRKIVQLRDKLIKGIDALNGLITQDFVDLQKLLESKGIRAAVAKPVVPPKKK